MKIKNKKIILASVSTTVALTSGLTLGLYNPKVVQNKENLITNRSSQIDLAITSNSENPDPLNNVLQDNSKAFLSKNIAQIIRQYSAGSYEKTESVVINGRTNISDPLNNRGSNVDIFGGYITSFSVSNPSANIMEFAFLVSSPEQVPTSNNAPLGPVDNLTLNRNTQFFVTYRLDLTTNVYSRSNRIALPNSSYNLRFNLANSNTNGSELDIKNNWTRNKATDIISDRRGGYFIFGDRGYIKHLVPNGLNFSFGNEKEFNLVPQFLRFNNTYDKKVLNNVHPSLNTGGYDLNTNSPTDTGVNNNGDTPVGLPNTSHIDRWKTTQAIVDNTGEFVYFAGEGQYVAKVRIATGEIVWRTHSLLTNNIFSTNAINVTLDANGNLIALDNANPRTLKGYSTYHTGLYFAQWSATATLSIDPITNRLFAFGGNQASFVEINQATGEIVAPSKQISNLESNSRVTHVTYLGNNRFAVASQVPKGSNSSINPKISILDTNGNSTRSNIDIFSQITLQRPHPAWSNPGSIAKIIPDGFGGFNILGWNVDVAKNEIYNARTPLNAENGQLIMPELINLIDGGGFGFSYRYSQQILRTFDSYLINVDGNGEIKNINSNWANSSFINEITGETSPIVRENHNSLRDIVYDGNGGYYGITVSNTLVHLNNQGNQLSWKSDIPNNDVSSNGYISTSSSDLQTILNNQQNQATASILSLKNQSLILATRNNVRVLPFNGTSTSNSTLNIALANNFIIDNIQEVDSNTYLLSGNNSSSQKIIYILRFGIGGAPILSNHHMIDSNSLKSNVLTGKIYPNGLLAIMVANNTNGITFLDYNFNNNTIGLNPTQNFNTNIVPTNAQIENLAISPQNESLVVAYRINNNLGFRIFGALSSRYRTNTPYYSSTPLNLSASSIHLPYIDITPNEASGIFTNSALPLKSIISNTFNRSSDTFNASDASRGNTALIYSLGQNIYSLNFNSLGSDQSNNVTQWGIPVEKALSFTKLTNANSLRTSNSSTLVSSDFSISAIESDGVGGYIIGGNSPILMRLGLVNGFLQLISYESYAAEFNNLIVNTIHSDRQGMFIVSGQNGLGAATIQINRLLTRGLIDIDNPYGQTFTGRPTVAQITNFWESYKNITSVNTISNGLGVVTLQRHQAYLLNRKAIKIPKNTSLSITDILRFKGTIPSVGNQVGFTINETDLWGDLGRDYYGNIDVQYSFVGFTTNNQQNWVTGSDNFVNLFKLDANFRPQPSAGFTLNAQQIQSFRPRHLMIRYVVNNDSLVPGFSSNNIAISTEALSVRGNSEVTSADMIKDLTLNHIIYLQSNATGNFIADGNSPFRPTTSNFWNSFFIGEPNNTNINSFRLVPADLGKSLSNQNLEIVLPRSMTDIPSIRNREVEVKFTNNINPTPTSIWYTLEEIKNGQLFIDSNTKLSWSFFTRQGQRITAVDSNNQLGNGVFGNLQTTPHEINNEQIIPINIPNSSVRDWNITLGGDTKNITIINSNTNAQVQEHLELQYAIGSINENNVFVPRIFNGNIWFKDTDFSNALKNNSIDITLGNNFIYARVVLKNVPNKTIVVSGNEQINTINQSGITFSFNTGENGLPILNGTQIFDGQNFTPVSNAKGLVKIFYNATRDFETLKSTSVIVGGSDSKNLSINFGQLSLSSLRSSGIDVQFSINNGTTWESYLVEGQLIDASVSNDPTKVSLRLFPRNNFATEISTQALVVKNVQARILISGLNINNLRDANLVNLSGNTRDLAINVDQNVYRGATGNSTTPITNIVQVRFAINGVLGGTFFEKDEFLRELRSLPRSILNAIRPGDFRVSFILLNNEDFSLEEGLSTPQIPNITNVKRLVDLFDHVNLANGSSIVSSGSTSRLSLSNPNSLLSETTLTQLGIVLEYGSYRYRANGDKIDVNYVWETIIPTAISSATPDRTNQNFNFAPNINSNAFSLAFRFKIIDENTTIIVNGNSNIVNPGVDGDLGFSINTNSLTKDIIFGTTTTSNFINPNDLQKIVLTGTTLNINQLISHSENNLLNSIIQTDIRNVLRVEYSFDSSNFYDFETFKKEANEHQKNNENWSLEYKNILLPNGTRTDIQGFGNIKKIFVKFEVKPEHRSQFTIPQNQSREANISGLTNGTHILGNALQSSYDISKWLNILNTTPITVAPGSTSDNVSGLVLPTPIEGLSVQDAINQLSQRGYIVEFNAPSGQNPALWVTNLNLITSVGNSRIIRVRVVPIGFRQGTAVAGNLTTGEISNGYTNIIRPNYINTTNPYSFNDGIDVRVSVPTTLTISNPSIALLNEIKPSGNTNQIILASQNNIDAIRNSLLANGIILNIPGVASGTVELQYAIGNQGATDLGTESTHLRQLTNSRTSRWYNAADFSKFLKEFVNQNALNAILGNNLNIYVRYGLTSSPALGVEGQIEGLLTDNENQLNQFRVQNPSPTLLTSTTQGFINVDRIISDISAANALSFNNANPNILSNSIFKIDLPLSLTEEGINDVSQFLRTNNLALEFSVGQNAGLDFAEWINLDQFNAVPSTTVNFGNPPRLVFRIRNTNPTSFVIYSQTSMTNSLVSVNIEAKLDNINVSLNLSSADINRVQFSGTTSNLVINDESATSNFYVANGDVELQYSLVKRANGIDLAFAIPGQNSLWLNKNTFSNSLARWIPTTFNATTGIPILDNVFTLNLNYNAANFQEDTFKIVARYVITTQGLTKRLSFTPDFRNPTRLNESNIVNINISNWSTVKTIINLSSLVNYLSRQNTIINFGNSIDSSNITSIILPDPLNQNPSSITSRTLVRFLTNNGFEIKYAFGNNANLVIANYTTNWNSNFQANPISLLRTNGTSVLGILLNSTNSNFEIINSANNPTTTPILKEGNSINIPTLINLPNLEIEASRIIFNANDSQPLSSRFLTIDDSSLLGLIRNNDNFPNNEQVILEYSNGSSLLPNSSEIWFSKENFIRNLAQNRPSSLITPNRIFVRYGLIDRTSNSFRVPTFNSRLTIDPNSDLIDGVFIPNSTNLKSHVDLSIQLSALTSGTRGGAITFPNGATTARLGNATLTGDISFGGIISPLSALGIQLQFSADNTTWFTYDPNNFQPQSLIPNNTLFARFNLTTANATNNFVLSSEEFVNVEIASTVKLALILDANLLTNINLSGNNKFINIDGSDILNPNSSFNVQLQTILDNANSSLLKWGIQNIGDLSVQFSSTFSSSANLGPNNWLTKENFIREFANNLGTFTEAPINLEIRARYFFTNPLNINLATASSNLETSIGNTIVALTDLSNRSIRAINSSSNIKIFINTNEFIEALRNGQTRFELGSTSSNIRGVPILPNNFNNEILNLLSSRYGIIAQFGTSNSSAEIPIVWSNSLISSLQTDINNKPILWMRFVAENVKGIVPTVEEPITTQVHVGTFGTPILLQPIIPISVETNSAHLRFVRITGNTKNINININEALALAPALSRDKLTVEFSIGGNPSNIANNKVVELIPGQIWYKHREFEAALANYPKNILHGNLIYMRWAFSGNQNNEGEQILDSSSILYVPSIDNGNSSFAVFADITKYFEQLQNITLGGTTNSPFFANVPSLLQANPELFENIPNDPVDFLFPGLELEFSQFAEGPWQKTPLSSIVLTNNYFVRLVSNSIVRINYVFSFSPTSDIVTFTSPVKLDTTNVKTIVNVPPVTQLQNIANISFSGTLNNLIITENINEIRSLIENLNPINKNLANNIVIQYSYFENPTSNQWFNKENFINELSRLKGRVSESEFIILKSQIKIKYAINNSSFIVGMNDSPIDDLQSQTNISLIQQNSFSGLINLDSSPLSLFKKVILSGTHNNYSLNFDGLSREAMKSILDRYTSISLQTPFSIYITNTAGEGIPSFEEGRLIYRSNNPLVLENITNFPLDLGNTIPEELPLFIRFVPNPTSADVANTYRILNEGNLLDVNQGIQFRIKVSVDPINPFRIDLKSVVDTIFANQLSNFASQIVANPNETFTIQGNSTLALTNGGSIISNPKEFFNELDLNDAEFLAFQYFVSNSRLSPQEIANLRLSTSSSFFTQEIPSNLKSGQFVYIRVGIDQNNPKANSLEVSNSSIITEVLVTNLAIDLVRSPLNWDFVDFENVTGTIPFSGTSFINNLILNVDQNENFRGVGIRIFNNFTYLTNTGQEVIFTNSNPPTQDVLNTLLKINGAFVVKTQIGIPSNGDKELKLINDQGSEAGITYWVNSQGVPLPPLQRAINVNEDLFFQLTRNPDGQISFAQNRSLANFELFNIYAEATISYQFIALDGFSGFINTENTTILDLLSQIQEFKVPSGEIKNQINGISQFEVLMPQIVHSTSPLNLPPISGISTFANLVVNRNGVQIDSNNLINNLSQNLLSIEIILTKTINGEQKQTIFSVQNGRIDFPTNLENGDLVTIQIIPLNSNFFAISYLEKPNLRETFTISGLEVDPGLEAFKFLRTGFNINNNSPVSGRGSFEVLSNDPQDPFNALKDPVNRNSNLQWNYSIFRPKANQDGTFGPEYEVISFERNEKPISLKNGDIVQWILALKNNENGGIITTTYNNAIASPFGTPQVSKLRIDKPGLFFTRLINGVPRRIDLTEGFLVSGLKESLSIPNDFNLNAISISFIGQNQIGSFEANTSNLNIPEKTIITYFKRGENGEEIQIFPNSTSTNLSNGETIIIRLQLDPQFNNDFALDVPSGAIIEINQIVSGLIEQSNPGAQIAIITAASVATILTLGLGVLSLIIIRRRKLKGK
ncbi:gliding machinery surface structure protein Gli521 [[Mycoplasma] mobile]|uniref:Gli521 adhesion and gliding protein n=2 Tax=[Mycoplasma] mobile TaxID=2118 RepID=F8WJV8_MYCM1|nr:Gli521 adhesion and gliding protein [[Mycoplasma] mobile]AAT27590.1 Gli521 adhesion and gliding protein [Mycoplasma mobile 163K]BAC23069.1 Gli521 [[Mycoplasma] mobile]